MACAICSSDANLSKFTVTPRDDVLLLCATCLPAAQGDISDAPHWQCLNDAIWSADAATQVLAFRLLSALPQSPWARDLLDIAYLEPETLDWAKAGLSDEPQVIHRDSNGVVLSAGDSVVLTKDLPVKGAGFTAKRGTPVRNISLVQTNQEHIEGRVESQRIVILTKFVKKTG
ncbi:alkylphosphonate utilization protein [Cognatishimia sp. WU-CL00825]|uniref:alkylphosphonate utilization protein n=1 Tax=Cognatishimia sp. WU-CL00825 TaxID=3127658 RepID=UPI0031024385